MEAQSLLLVNLKRVPAEFSGIYLIFSQILCLLKLSKYCSPISIFVRAYFDFYVMDVKLACDNLKCVDEHGDVSNDRNQGKKTCFRREFSSLNYKFLKSFPERVALAMEFDFLEKQTFVTRELMCNVRRCSESGGGSFAHLQRQIRDFHFDNFIRMKTDYYNRFYVWSHGVAGLMADVNLRTPDQFGDMNSPDGFNFQSTDVKTLRHLFSLDFKRREKYLNGAMVTNFGSVLAFDHTFLSQSLHGVGYGQHGTLMNSHKMILSFVLVNNDSTEDLEDMVDSISLRYEEAQQLPPSIIYQDKECCSGKKKSLVSVGESSSDTTSQHCKETKMLKLWRRLNPSIVLKLDIFHWMRRLLRGITNEKHIFVPGFFREIRLAVFVLHLFKKILIAC